MPLPRPCNFHCICRYISVALSLTYLYLSVLLTCSSKIVRESLRSDHITIDAAFLSPMHPWMPEESKQCHFRLYLPRTLNVVWASCSPVMRSVNFSSQRCSLASCD